MRYLHTMLRVRDLDAALDFYRNKLGLNEMRRRVDEKNKFTLVFLAAPGDADLVAKVSTGLGEAMAGQEIATLGVHLAERGW